MDSFPSDDDRISHRCQISTFSSDIAHAVSRGIGEAAGEELPAQTTADWLPVRETHFPSGKVGKPPWSSP
jgi:hypothetical protein